MIAPPACYAEVVRAILFVACVALIGCKGDRDPFEEEIPPPLGDNDGGLGGSGGPGGECAEDTKDVFVISEEKVLYRFNPPTLAFKAVGIMSCPTGGATPTSMAVDRLGTAWVRHSDASIWRVSTRNLQCLPTPFVPPSDGTFFQFGMGFSSSAAGSSQEDLYLSDSSGAGLAKLDTTTLKVSFLGRYTAPLDGRASELTGTGDGKLYGFFVDAPAQVAEISKANGAIANARPLSNVYAGTAWAFSFYGGDFYIYTYSQGSGGFPRAGGGSDVTRYSPVTGAIEIVKPKIGFKIVGAGVSTCAPTAPPR
jgi:hypothetical protein